MNDNNIINGDCIEELKKLPDNSIDAIITDPPYGLEFMGKDWDKFKEGKNIAGGTTGEGTPFGRSKAMPSFYQMNKKRFGIKGEEGSDLLGFQEFTTNWASECLRVLKPGGYLLSFGGTRTYHRMACGIEDAGFEIRDTIMWVYGSGFPKSLNIGKQIDKIQGNEREVVGKIREGRNTDGGYGKNYGSNIDDTKGNSEWEGWGTALKPALEPIVVARKPLSEKNVALNVLKWGTGGINIDECRIPTNEVLSIGSNNHSQASVFQHNQILNSKQNELGRFPANIILDEEAGRMLDEQSGITIKKDLRNESLGGFPDGYVAGTPKSQLFKRTPDFGGGASRFFYCAKASKSERNNGCEEFEGEYKSYVKNRRCKKCGYQEVSGSPCKCENPEWEIIEREVTTKNNHPTVKPIALMEYLIKLVSKENAVILEPFLGSGTTAIACIKTNRRFIGIEKEPEYVKIAQARIKPYLEQRKLLLEEKQNE